MLPFHTKNLQILIYKICETFNQDKRLKIFNILLLQESATSGALSWLEEILRLIYCRARRHPDIPISYVLVLLLYIPLLVIPTLDMSKIKIVNVWSMYLCSLFLFPIFIQVSSNIEHFQSKNCSIFISIFGSMNIKHFETKCFSIFIQIFVSMNINHFQTENCSIFIPIFVSINSEHFQTKNCSIFFYQFCQYEQRTFLDQKMFYIYTNFVSMNSEQFQTKKCSIFRKNFKEDILIREFVSDVPTLVTHTTLYHTLS